mgnify:CR=1 FL=1
MCLKKLISTANNPSYDYESFPKTGDAYAYELRIDIAPV